LKINNIVIKIIVRIVSIRVPFLITFQHYYTLDIKKIKHEKWTTYTEWLIILPPLRIFVWYKIILLRKEGRMFVCFACFVNLPNHKLQLRFWYLQKPLTSTVQQGDFIIFTLACKSDWIMNFLVIENSI
jgi:hypothetical protein